MSTPGSSLVGLVLGPWSPPSNGPFDSLPGQLCGLYDRYFTADGRLPLCPFDQDLWKDEDRCRGKFMDVFPCRVWGPHVRLSPRASVFAVDVILHGDVLLVAWKPHVGGSPGSCVSETTRVLTGRLAACAECGGDFCWKPGEMSFLLWSRFPVLCFGIPVTSALLPGECRPLTPVRLVMDL